MLNARSSRFDDRLEPAVAAFHVESGQDDPTAHVRATIRHHVHPAGPCPLGSVVDGAGRVLGLTGLVLADASIMPMIPRANTNLTVAAVAERIGTTL